MIIRCEHPDTELGPYSHYGELGGQYLIIASLPWVLEHNDIFGKHPTPEVDGLPYKHNYRLGFSCLDQMYSWFTVEQRIDLINKGFHFIYLKPNAKVYYGKAQCLFYRPSAKIIGPVEEVIS